MMRVVSEKWRAFCEWQQRPYRVAPMPDEQHRCFTCGQEFKGNYCPNCGQSARLGRYSFKSTLSQFVEVWGVGDRSVFRTLRDLLLRPGYMIRDYISGMRMAYFPPFKLLFLLTAILLVVHSGVNLGGKNSHDAFYDERVKPYEKSLGKEVKTEHLTYMERWDAALNKILYHINDSTDKRPAVVILVVVLVLTLPIYFFFRKSPNIPDMRFSELSVAITYMFSMLITVAIVFSFFSISLGGFGKVFLLMPLIPLKQLTGFAWWKVILFVALSLLMAYVIFLVLLALFTGILALVGVF